MASLNTLIEEMTSYNRLLKYINYRVIKTISISTIIEYGEVKKLPKGVKNVE
jgi:hypothetical protein